MRSGAVSLLLVAFAVCLAGGRPAIAADLADIDRLLAGSEILRADFVQERHMTVLEQPLTSQGRLTFSADEGVLWSILEPYPVVILLRRDEILEWADDGTSRRLNAGGNPIYVALADVFLSALAGNATGLTRTFTASPTIDGETWRLELVPQDALVGTAIDRIELSGARYVESVRIVESRGDETLIRFSNFSEQPGTLDESERHFFAE
jgi:hypothetical protein